MKLKDFLKWETPQMPPTSQYGDPRFWLLKSNSGYMKLACNRRWVQVYMPEMDDEDKKKKRDVGIGISVDRDNKCIFIVFDPGKEVPQFIAKHNADKSGTVTIMNKLLCEDLWLSFDFPMDVNRQFFTTELHQEVEGKKVFKISYDPELPINLNELIAAKKKGNGKKS